MKLKRLKTRICKYCCKVLPAKNWNTCDSCKKEKYGLYMDSVDTDYVLSDVAYGSKNFYSRLLF